MVGSDYYGDVAIGELKFSYSNQSLSCLVVNVNFLVSLTDDIFVDTKNPCPPVASCSFEDSLCLWTKETQSNFDFLRISAEQLKTIKTPANYSRDEIDEDVTLNTKYGTEAHHSAVLYLLGLSLTSLIFQGHFLWIAPNFYNGLGENKKSAIISETIICSDKWASGAW